jgi:hypothetical protein
MQWLQNPSQSNAGYLNNVQCIAFGHFRNKTKKYLTAKIDEIETNRKIKISEIYIGAPMTLREVTSLELI